MSIRDLFIQHKKRFVLYVFGILIIAPSNIMITFAIANAFKILEVSNNSEIIRLAIMTVALGLSPIILQVISRYLRMSFMRDILVSVRMLSYENFLSNTIEEFSVNSQETYQSQLISDINLFENDFFLSLLNIIYAFFNFVLGLIVLTFISPLLGILTFIFALILFIITKLFEKKSLKKKELVLDENSKFHSILSNMLNGLETIKLFSVTKNFKNMFFKSVNSLEDKKSSSFKIILLQTNLMQWLSSTFHILSIIYGAYLYSLDKITLSSLVIIFNLVGQLVWGMNNGFKMANRYKTSKAIFNNISNFKNVEVLEHKFKFEEELKIEKLNYIYNDQYYLKDFNFSLKPLNKLLIVGESGSGKSSLIELIIKNINDYKGLITYDGIDLKDIDYNSIKSKVGYVRQSHFIFDASIKDNIILDKDFNEKKLNQVLEAVLLSEWVSTLDEGYDFKLKNNASNISGGQRQRISIARELYKDKEFLIFDEPSASLDTKTSKAIYDVIINLNKTVIVISHRHTQYLANNFDAVLNLSKVGKKHE